MAGVIDSMNNFDKSLAKRFHTYFGAGFFSSSKYVYPEGSFQGWVFSVIYSSGLTLLLKKGPAAAASAALLTTTAKLIEFGLCVLARKYQPTNARPLDSNTYISENGRDLFYALSIVTTVVAGKMAGLPVHLTGTFLSLPVLLFAGHRYHMGYPTTPLVMPIGILVHAY